MGGKNNAQGNVISMVLIVLISLVLIMIVWNFVSPLVSEKSRDIDISSLSVDLDVKDAVLYETGAAHVSVSRGTGKAELSGLKFIFRNKEGETHIEDINENLPGELDSETYSFSPFSGFKIYEVSVAPLIGKKIGRESSVKKGVFEVPLGLLGWWRFEDNTDSAGRHSCNEMNLINDLERESVGNFNSVEVICGDLDIDDKIGISFWIKSNDEEGIILKKGDNYEVSLENGRIKFSFGGSDGISDLEVNDGNWNHVVINGNPEGVSIIYINKEPKIIDLGSPSLDDEPLLIGGFDGRLDELMIFEQGLSISQVEGLYSHQKI